MLELLPVFSSVINGQYMQVKIFGGALIYSSGDGSLFFVVRM